MSGIIAVIAIVMGALIINLAIFRGKSHVEWDGKLPYKTIMAVAAGVTAIIFLLAQ